MAVPCVSNSHSLAELSIVELSNNYIVSNALLTVLRLPPTTLLRLLVGLRARNALLTVLKWPPTTLLRSLVGPRARNALLTVLKLPPSGFVEAESIGSEVKW